ncbi:uncharacterized protein [Rutidosis leptorrhynchoides]|uniref:uncharacterized protein n=1 Tax=Rutidosis leptorrhynchoides TaxID=125765 RepID=UPI003A9A3D05
MASIAAVSGLISLQFQHPSIISHQFLPFPPKFKPIKQFKPIKSQKSDATKPKSKEPQTDDGIPIDQVKTLVKFKSRHNFIRVLEISRKSDHPFAGSRLLLLDTPGNIHSISFLLKLLTGTYFDVFATLPPILPPGPLGILGFGAGSAAKLILELYPQGTIHGWEIDPAVVSVAREYFGVGKLERKYPDRLFIYEGNALNAEIESGFSGLLVDLFSNGRVSPELQDPETWVKLKRKLRDGGRIMVNVGGSCVEAEDGRIDGRVVMEETLKAMGKVFEDQVFVLNLGSRMNDSSIAVTGNLNDLDLWKENLNKSLRFYVDMWKPYSR